jgi:hypothetical protein
MFAGFERLGRDQAGNGRTLVGGSRPIVGYEFCRGLDHGSIIAASERVAWTVDEVFRGRSFDASRALVPASWVGADGLPFLDDAERCVLNHCRAFSYVHLLGNFEEFAPPHLGRIVEQDWHDDRARLRALLRFGEEEMKHQQLLRRAEGVLEESCGHAFGRYFDDDKVRVTALTNAILSHPALPRFLMVLALEWGTQRHYVESVSDQTVESGDALYVDILKAHWVEEAQHVKSDALEIARLAGGMSPAELCGTFDHVLALGGLVDTAFAGQADQEIATLQQVTGRAFSEVEATTLHETLHRSLSANMAGVGLTHPQFAKMAVELSAEGAAKLGIA